MEQEFFEEWRRESITAVRDLVVRLTAVEARLTEGQYVIERHTMQVHEMNAALAEAETRLGGLEKREVQDAMARIRDLESENQRRKTREELQREDKQTSQTGIGRAVLTTVACTAASGVVITIMAIIGFLVTQWIKSGGTP